MLQILHVKNSSQVKTNKQKKKRTLKKTPKTWKQVYLYLACLVFILFSPFWSFNMFFEGFALQTSSSDLLLI